jgi:hypothetical protein
MVLVNMNGTTDMTSIFSIDQTGIDGNIFQRPVLDGGSDHIYNRSDSIVCSLFSLEQSTDGGALFALRGISAAPKCLG